MKITRFAFGLFLFVAFFSSASNGQSGTFQRTFVSGTGSDTMPPSNTCTRQFPCRTFAYALTQTVPTGEVVALDSAGYGGFSLTHAVSIIGPPGVYAGVSVSSGDAIVINALAMSDTITLRGLTVKNQGSTGNGIVFNSGGRLRIESCVVNRFESQSQGFSKGILFQGDGLLEVRDSAVIGNTEGIRVAPPSGSTARVTIDNVRLEGNSSVGLVVQDGSFVSVSNSVASGNLQYGFLGVSTAAAGLQLNLERCLATNNVMAGILNLSNSTGAAEINLEGCMISGNSVGVQAISSSTGVSRVRVSNSMVTDNGQGLVNNGSPAVILSRGNNTVEGNGTDTSGTIGSYTAK
jgi:hypothetical protein